MSNNKTNRKQNRYQYLWVIEITTWFSLQCILDDLLSEALQQFPVPKYTLGYQEQGEEMDLKHGAN